MSLCMYCVYMYMCTFMCQCMYLWRSEEDTLFFLCFWYRVGFSLILELGWQWVSCVGLFFFFGLQSQVCVVTPALCGCWSLCLCSKCCYPPKPSPQSYIYLIYFELVHQFVLCSFPFFSMDKNFHPHLGQLDEFLVGLSLEIMNWFPLWTKV